MRFSIFESPKAQRGIQCTYEKFLEVTNSQQMLDLCKKIAAETDPDKRSELKKQLPVVTWQAFFPGRRIVKEAQPSGLFMLDIDHVDDPYDLYRSKVASQLTNLGIVFVSKTASTHGLRIVAKCLPTLNTIEECQRWLASNLKVDYDGVCKDWARCSFLVHDSYTYYMDAKGLFQDEPSLDCIYRVESGLSSAKAQNGNIQVAIPAANEPAEGEVDQREGLFGGQDDYKGIPLTQLATEWLEQTGGMPQQGERNARLYKLALRMRYLTDFNAATMMRVIPDCGLPVDEFRQLVSSAISTTRAADMPRDMQQVINNIETRNQLASQSDTFEDDEEIITDTSELPPCPPVIRQFVETAPDDFKAAVILCQLPILGTLGSKLRAVYLDGKTHSPSFQVSLEAPQASGKSFMRQLADTELAQILEHDAQQRDKEREYDAKVKEIKLLNMKVDKKNKDEILGSRPEGIIRYVPATISITKLLQRMNVAKGLHLFAMAEEIDTVTKAFKRGFSSYSDLLRVSFDNGPYGQDYASENSFSGIVNIYYNFLTSGTPKAMRRFYPDVEDGLVSRVCFVTLPDQFGKTMPVWDKMTAQQQQIVDINLTRLNEISIQGDDVQPEYLMKMDWLNKTLQNWIILQQQKAVKDNDRTRDIFCRRAAVVGFRAGMLAWFLYGEKGTPTIRKNVTKFSVWIANYMLNQHLLRFNITSTSSNTLPHEELYNALGNVFTIEDLLVEMSKQNVLTNERQIIYRWRLAGLISGDRKQRGVSQTYKKIR